MTENGNSIAKLYDLLKWILPIISKFPKDKRYTLGQRIENKLLDILDLLICANYSKDKISYLKQANLGLENLRYLIRLSADLYFINIKRYEYISQQINEIGRLVGGWVKSQPAR
jgi:hypothetical protein